MSTYGASASPLGQFRSRAVGISTFRCDVGSRLKVKEKYLLGVGALLFVCICYSTFVLLPTGDNRPLTNATPLNVRAKLEQVLRQPDQLVLPPPDWAANKSVHFRHMAHNMDQDHDDPHRHADQLALQRKIDDDAQIPRPKPPDAQVPVIGGADSQSAAPNVAAVADSNVHEKPSLNLAPASSGSKDEQNEKRREKIVDMMKHAWDNYEKYAWGANELRPISKTGHSASIFGAGKMGATIIDGMDTLHIMGLMDRFDKGKKWVEMTMNVDDMRGDMSVFETNIRFVGGLLTLYALTHDDVFKTKAKQVADLLLPAFNTPTGIPLALVNAKSKGAKNWGWASGGSSILSEFGTLHLEFVYLSKITGDPTYAHKVLKIRNFLDKMDKPDGLYPNYLNPKTGKWGSKHVSLGALGDSFYEYLIKTYVFTEKRDTQAKTMYDQAMQAVERQLLVKSRNGLTYIAEMKGNRLDHKMDHLACFTAGMFVLDAVSTTDADKHDHWLDIGKEIGRTCHQSYVQTQTGIGPESFRFTNEFEAKTINERDKYYILRPEVIEGWFYLWRATKDQKYRDWAWNAAQSIETHCRVDGGYSGIRNVYSDSPVKDDVQQSFFLAETLKYLYLIFCDDNVMALDKWVFNTEAHPLPVASDYLISIDDPTGGAVADNANANVVNGGCLSLSQDISSIIGLHCPQA